MKIRPQASEIVNFGPTKALRAVDAVDEVGSVRSGRATLRVQCLLLARLFSLRTGCRILREGSLCSDGRRAEGTGTSHFHCRRQVPEN